MPPRALDLAADLAKPFEGLRLEPYHDPVGYPTIGHGHLLSKEPWADLSQWPAITAAQAESLLIEDMTKAGGAVKRLCPVDLTDSQRAALIDFAFNLGAGALQASALRQAILREDHETAAGQFGRWVFARGRKLPGLVLRRAAESTLYSK